MQAIHPDQSSNGYSSIDSAVEALEHKPSNILEPVALEALVEAATRPSRPVVLECSSIQPCGHSIGFHSLDLMYIHRLIGPHRTHKSY